MKIKHDFVTNSSSTSYVVWGIELNDSEILENEKLINLAYEYYLKDYNEYTIEEFKNKIDLVKENLEWSDIDKFLEISTGQNCDDFWIGGRISDLKDDQTLGEYKQQIIESLRKIGIETDSVYLICESWWNG